MKTFTVKILSSFTLGAALALLSACGGSDDSGASGGTSGSASEPAAGAVDKTVTIEANDQMKYDTDVFYANRGDRIKIHLKNVGSMPEMSMGHNVVVLFPGSDETGFVSAAANAAANDYIPEAFVDSVVAHTEMTGGGEEATVVFTVPNKDGTYPFLCSFPGHYQVGMKGSMVVR